MFHSNGRKYGPLKCVDKPHSCPVSFEIPFSPHREPGTLNSLHEWLSMKEHSWCVHPPTLSDRQGCLPCLYTCSYPQISMRLLTVLLKFGHCHTLCLFISDLSHTESFQPVPFRDLSASGPSGHCYRCCDRRLETPTFFWRSVNFAYCKFIFCDLIEEN